MFLLPLSMSLSGKERGEDFLFKAHKALGHLFSDKESLCSL